MVCIWVGSINTLVYPARTATWVKEQVWELSVTLDGEQVCLQETFHHWTRATPTFTQKGEKKRKEDTGNHGNNKIA